MKYYRIEIREKVQSPEATLVYVYGEMDDDLWETRRVEIFKDGSYRFTDGQRKVGDIRLAENKMDDNLPNVNADDERAYIHIDYVVKDDFERIWKLAKRYAEDNGITEGGYR